MSHIDERTGKPKIILDLCGGTGAWGEPYEKAGYDVREVTLPKHDVRDYEPPENVYGVLAAPPCTEFSILNCIAENRERDFEAGFELVRVCRDIIQRCDPVFWALENPTGYLRKFLGVPLFSFQPWWYGDPWTKRTDLWGEFVPPKRIYQNWDDVPKLDLYIRPNRGKPSIAYLHKSSIDKIPKLLKYKDKITCDADFRAITPPGFAKAFFEVNR